MLIIVLICFYLLPTHLTSRWSRECFIHTLRLFVLDQTYCLGPAHVTDVVSLRQRYRANVHSHRESNLPPLTSQVQPLPDTPKEKLAIRWHGWPATYLRSEFHRFTPVTFTPLNSLRRSADANQVIRVTAPMWRWSNRGLTNTAIAQCFNSCSTSSV